MIKKICEGVLPLGFIMLDSASNIKLLRDGVTLWWVDQGLDQSIREKNAIRRERKQIRELRITGAATH